MGDSVKSIIKSDRAPQNYFVPNLAASITQEYLHSRVSFTVASELVDVLVGRLDRFRGPIRPRGRALLAGVRNHRLGDRPWRSGQDSQIITPPRFLEPFDPGNRVK